MDTPQTLLISLETKNIVITGHSNIIADFQKGTLVRPAGPGYPNVSIFEYTLF